jgi:hypothetical protein
MPEPNPAAELVLATVAAYFCVRVERVTGAAWSTLHIRQVATHFLRGLGLSYPEIGRMLGRDHVTILRGYQKFEQMLAAGAPDAVRHVADLLARLAPAPTVAAAPAASLAPRAGAAEDSPPPAAPAGEPPLLALLRAGDDLLRQVAGFHERLRAELEHLEHPATAPGPATMPGLMVGVDRPGVEPPREPVRRAAARAAGRATLPNPAPEPCIWCGTVGCEGGETCDGRRAARNELATGRKAE